MMVVVMFVCDGERGWPPPFPLSSMWALARYLPYGDKSISLQIPPSTGGGTEEGGQEGGQEDIIFILQRVPLPFHHTFSYF